MNRRPLLDRSPALALTLLLFLTASGPGCRKAPPPQESARTLVRVNGDPITEKDVERRLGAALGGSGREQVDPGLRQRLTEQAVESEILDRLLLQAAKAEGYTVPPARVDSDLSRTRELMGEEAFAAMLDEQGATAEQYREYLRGRLLVDRYREALFETIEVAEPDLEAYFDGHPERFAEPEKVRLQMLVFEDAEAADAAQRRLQAGDAFEEVARDHGDAGGRTARTRPMPLAAVPDGLRKAIEGASAGDVRRSDEAGTTYLARLIERIPGSSRTFEEAREDVEDALRDLRQQKLLDDWYEARLKEADIEHIKKP